MWGLTFTNHRKRLKEAEKPVQRITASITPPYSVLGVYAYMRSLVGKGLIFHGGEGGVYVYTPNCWSFIWGVRLG